MAPLIDLAGEGVAAVSAGQVTLAPGDIAGPIPVQLGFSSSVANAQGHFEAGGANATFACGPLFDDEACIQGGGFGGAMALGGLYYEGLSLDLWGSGGQVDFTVPPSLLVAHAQAEPWTTGRASAWFYLPLIDATPFLMSETGTHRGLPSTYTGTETAGFTLVAPMVVRTTYDANQRARGIARLEVRFVPEPAPLILLATGSLALGSPSLGASTR